MTKLVGAVWDQAVADRSEETSTSFEARHYFTLDPRIDPLTYRMSWALDKIYNTYIPIGITNLDTP